MNLTAFPARLSRTWVKTAFVAPSHRKIFGHGRCEREAFRARQRLHGRHGGSNHLPDGIAIERQRKPARFDLRQIEHVIDQPEKMPAIGLHPRHGRLGPVREFAIDPIDQQFGEAQNGIERRPEFVAHICEELRLVAAGGLQFPAFLLNLAEQLGILNGKHRLGREGFHEMNDLVGRIRRAGVA